MNIFGYYNYRTYLKDYYEYKKSRDRHFTYRKFAESAGIKSPSLYVDMINGRRNITPALLPKFSIALGLNEKESQYLMQMMHFTHAKSQEAKEETFNKMAKMLPSTARKLSKDQRAYYEHWYISAIREALAVISIADDFQDLALFLTPRVSLPKVKSAMQLLIDLDIIEKQNGFWRSKNGSINGDHIDIFTMHDVQKQFMDLGKASLDVFTQEKRNVSALSMSISEEGVQRLIHKIDVFRKEAIEIVRADTNENQVYHLNVQFFPISKEAER
ncbi:MAG: TIGR02147 family protein [Fibrobacterales bacterium]